MQLQHYSRRVELPVSAEEAFCWHERPGALQRLVPPWEDVRVEHQSGGVGDGARVILYNRVGPFRFRWVAEHDGYDFGRQFRDTQLAGPFARWRHTHRFIPVDGSRCVLEDDIEYAVPGGALGDWVGGKYIAGAIDRMFVYRHETTVADLAAHCRYAASGTRHMAVTGSSGLIGSTLIPLLTTGGHRVTRLVRSNPGLHDVLWDPLDDSWDASGLDSVDAVVHLAGVNIAARRWTSPEKERIRNSRVQGTRNLSEALARMKKPPAVLVSASAVGIYGDRGEEALTEQSSPGSGFLAEVCRDWEAALRPAVEAGIRVVVLRLGIVLSPKSGALATMATPFRMGVGARLGDGRQWWSWISVDDAAGAILHALMTDSLAGPVNGVAPMPVTNREFTRTLGRVLRRPALLRLPDWAARVVAGGLADELLLASERVLPAQLVASGYPFRHPALETALRSMLGR